MASLFTSVSREKLRNTTPSFMTSQACASIMPMVPSMAGTWMVR